MRFDHGSKPQEELLSTYQREWLWHMHNSYAMSTCGLPDVYTLRSLACGSKALGVHIRQITRVHGINIT